MRERTRHDILFVEPRVGFHSIEVSDMHPYNLLGYYETVKMSKIEAFVISLNLKGPEFPDDANVLFYTKFDDPKRPGLQEAYTCEVKHRKYEEYADIREVSIEAYYGPTMDFKNVDGSIAEHFSHQKLH